MTPFPVFPCGVLHSDPKFPHAGMANAILIDKAKGIFVTNAHCVNYRDRCETNKFYVYLPLTRRWHQLEFDPTWVNWDCDVAFLRSNENLSSYPDVTLRRSNANLHSGFSIIGYAPSEEEGAPRQIKCIVSDWRAAYGITYPMLRTMWDVEKQRVLARGQRHVRYKDYIQLGLIDGARITPGLSGSPVLDDENQLVGMVSQGGSMALAIPHKEFDESSRKRIMECPKPKSIGRRLAQLICE